MHRVIENGDACRAARLRLIHGEIRIAQQLAHGAIAQVAEGYAGAPDQDEFVILNEEAFERCPLVADSVSGLRRRAKIT